MRRRRADDHGLSADWSGNRSAWGRRDWIALLFLTGIAGVIRFVDLSGAESFVFDETYYAKQACWSLRHSLDLCELSFQPDEFHPPLGKLLIMAGIEIANFGPLGWRLLPALAGTISVALLYILARRILRSTLGAFVSAGLLAVCFLHFVQSRLAMLDIFVLLFGVAAFAAMAFDRERLLGIANMSSGRGGPGLWQPWRLAAGVAIGAAVASKWSGFLIWAAIALLAVSWSLGKRRSGGVRGASRTLLLDLAGMVFYLGAVPFFVYIGFYAIGQADGDILAAFTSQGRWEHFWEEQLRLFRYHSNFPATHPHQSPPWSWLLVMRPVVYFVCSGVSCESEVGQGELREILATGNPLTWWLSLPLLAGIGLRWLRRRDMAEPDGFILAGFAITYFPWFVLSIGRPQVFLFYILPTLPFVYLAFGYVATKIEKSWEGRLSIALFCLGAVTLFGYYYPLLTAGPISTEQWQRRMWIFTQCGPESSAGVTQSSATEKRGLVGGTGHDPLRAEPMAGWCWV